MKNNPLRVLVTGSKGQLGTELQVLSVMEKELDFVFVDIEELDITSESDINRFFIETNPDYCINCAAYTAVDQAESDPDAADKINHLACKYLAEACRASSTTLIHISTDFVFDGSGSTPITEEQPAHPNSQYGLSKLRGEQAILDSLESSYIVRTSWLYSIYGNNFVKTMLRLGKEREELRVIADQEGTPTYAADLAAALIKMIHRDSGTDKSLYGVYHYSNEGVASWYDFAKAIFEHSGVTTQVQPITTAEYPTPAKRPMYSVLDKEKIKATFDLVIPEWNESLKRCLAILHQKV